MAKVVTDNKHYTDIADAMREKTGKSELLKPEEMPDEVGAVYDEGFDRGRDFFRSITDWYEFFYAGHRLDWIDNLRYDDTSNGTNFSRIFSMCEALTTVPLFDTSKGTSFGGMFTYCQAIKNIPVYDTSGGTNFDNMFNECKALTDVPLIDTSKATSFRYFMCNCTSVKNIPHFDMSKGKDFLKAFCGCKAITSAPNFDTSNGTIFYQMFGECSKLIEAPLIDTSKGTDFTGMFYYCTSLKTVPKINMTNGTTGVTNFFQGASNLENITFEGTIPLSLNASYSAKLTRASIESMVNALLDSASGKTLTLKTTNVNNAFETSAGAADGSTSADWAALIAKKPNWTFSLI